MSEGKIENKDTTSSILDQNESHHFKNMYGELDFYKKKCEVLEKDVFKIQTQNKKIESMLKQMQELNSINAKNVNNTSSSFLLPSEFKSIWESLTKDLLLEAFENLFEDYFWLSHLTQDTVKIVYEESSLIINEIISGVLQILKINNNTNLEAFLPRFRLLFQDFFTSIFAFNDEFNEKIKEKLRKVIKTYKNFEDKEESCLTDIESKPFKILIQTLYKLCIYMLLHEPILTLNIPQYVTRNITYHFYNKNEFINIEGFGNEKSSCAVILFPPVLRKNFFYQGIKPAVYILPEADDTIKLECEKNKPVHKDQKRSNSINDVSNMNCFNVSKKVDSVEKVHSSPGPINKNKNKASSVIVDTPNCGAKGGKTNTNLIALTDKKYDKKMPLSVTLQKLNNLKEKLSASNLELDEDPQMKLPFELLSKNRLDNDKTENTEKNVEKTEKSEIIEKTDHLDKIIKTDKSEKIVNNSKIEIINHIENSKDTKDNIIGNKKPSASEAKEQFHMQVIKSEQTQPNLQLMPVTRTHSNSNLNEHRENNKEIKGLRELKEKIESREIFNRDNSNRDRENKDFNHLNLKEHTNSTVNSNSHSNINLHNSNPPASTFNLKENMKNIEMRDKDSQNLSKTPRTHIERLETEQRDNSVLINTSEILNLNDKSNISSSNNNTFTKIRTKTTQSIKKLDHSYTVKSELGSKVYEPNKINYPLQENNKYSTTGFFVQLQNNIDKISTAQEYVRRKNVDTKLSDSTTQQPIPSQNNYDKNDSFYKNSSMYEKFDKPETKEKPNKFSLLPQNSNNNSLLNRKNSQTSDLNTSESSIKKITNDLIPAKEKSLTTNNFPRFQNVKIREDPAGLTNSTYSTYTTYIKNKNLNNDLGLPGSQSVNTNNEKYYTSVLKKDKLPSKIVNQNENTNSNSNSNSNTNTNFHYNNFLDNYTKEDQHSSRREEKECATAIGNKFGLEFNSADIFNGPKKDNFMARMNKLKEKSRERSSDNRNHDAINSSNSKINRLDIQNKIDKYYMKIKNNYVNNSPKKATIPISFVTDMRMKDSGATAHKDKSKNMELGRLKNNINIHKK